MDSSASSDASSRSRTPKEATIGIRPCLTLRSKLTRDELQKSGGTYISYHAPQDKKPRQCDCELLSMGWRLGLRWTIRNNTYQFALFVKMAPTPEVAEKLGDVHIIAGRPIVKVDWSEREITFKPNTPIILKKHNSYQSDLHNGIITCVELNFGEIVVEVDIYPVDNTLEIIKPIEIPPCSVVQDFSKLMPQNEEESKERLCDVKITCTTATDEDEAPQQAVFYAHKAILATRSPVFARMFASDMKESATNTVDLPDIEPDVLEELLTYIYSGECPNIKRHAESLLYQAEKYEMRRLKALCEERLSYDIQVDNAARILLLADECDAEGLKKNSILFINEHGDKVQNTTEWSEVRQNSDLLHELLTTMYGPPAKKRKTQY